MSRRHPPSDGNYEVGYGRPPKQHRIKPGEVRNPRGRPPGSTNRRDDLGGELRRTLGKPVKVRQGGEVVEKSVSEIMGERLKSILLTGTVRELEVALRIIQTFAPDTLELPPQAIRILYERASGSTVALPPSDLF